MVKALKGLVVFALLFSFLGSIFGIQINKHYCGDFLEEISLYVKPNPCMDDKGGDGCSMGDLDSCCDDETEFYQLKIDVIKHSQKDYEHPIAPATLDLLPNQIFQNKIEPITLGEYFPSPPPSPIPIFKLLHRYTFYN